MILKVITYILPVILLGLVGCRKNEAVASEKTESPATVHNLVKETSLTTITLTIEAEKRLGIETKVVEYRSVDRSRTFGGEVVPVSGASVTVTAPLSGTILSAQNNPPDYCRQQSN